MAKLTQEDLKSKFERGDIPTQEDFVDLIDTLESNSAVTYVNVNNTGGTVWEDVNTQVIINNPTQTINVIFHAGTHYLFNGEIGVYGLSHTVTVEGNYIVVGANSSPGGIGDLAGGSIQYNLNGEFGGVTDFQYDQDFNEAFVGRIRQNELTASVDPLNVVCVLDASGYMYESTFTGEYLEKLVPVGTVNEVQYRGDDGFLDSHANFKYSVIDSLLSVPKLELTNIAIGHEGDFMAVVDEINGEISRLELKPEDLLPSGAFREIQFRNDVSGYLTSDPGFKFDTANLICQSPKFGLMDPQTSGASDLIIGRNSSNSQLNITTVTTAELEGLVPLAASTTSDINDILLRLDALEALHP